jgi:hypothetical protein
MQNIISPFGFNVFTKIYMSHQGFPFQQEFRSKFAQQQSVLWPGLLPVTALVQTLSGIGAPDMLLDAAKTSLQPKSQIAYKIAKTLNA